MRQTKRERVTSELRAHSAWQDSVPGGRCPQLPSDRNCGSTDDCALMRLLFKHNQMMPGATPALEAV